MRNPTMKNGMGSNRKQHIPNTGNITIILGIPTSERRPHQQQRRPYVFKNCGKKEIRMYIGLPSAKLEWKMSSECISKEPKI